MLLSPTATGIAEMCKAASKNRGGVIILIYLLFAPIWPSRQLTNLFDINASFDFGDQREKSRTHG